GPGATPATRNRALAAGESLLARAWRTYHSVRSTVQSATSATIPRRYKQGRRLRYTFVDAPPAVANDLPELDGIDAAVQKIRGEHRRLSASGCCPCSHRFLSCRFVSAFRRAAGFR